MFSDDIIALFFHGLLTIGDVVALKDSFLRHNTNATVAEVRRALLLCFAVHDFTVGSIFIPSTFEFVPLGHVHRQVSGVTTVLHSGSKVLAFDLLVVHQLSVNHTEAEAQPCCRFCIFQWS